MGNFMKQVVQTEVLENEKNLLPDLGKKLRKSQGQTAVEYMLIIAVIVAVIFTLGKIFKTQFAELSNTVFAKIKGQVNSDQ